MSFLGVLGAKKCFEDKIFHTEHGKLIFYTIFYYIFMKKSKKKILIPV